MALNALFSNALPDEVALPDEWGPVTDGRDRCHAMRRGGGREGHPFREKSTPAGANHVRFTTRLGARCDRFLTEVWHPLPFSISI